jgi:hypothetical protein
MHTLRDTRYPGPDRAQAVLPRAFVGTQMAYEQICAWGRAMGWDEKPFDFVVEQWLASRADRARNALLTMPR